MSRNNTSTERLLQVLAATPFFSGFDEEDLRRVVELSDEISVASSTVLIDQGDAGADCYVILEGTVSVYVRGEHIASVGAGSMVGEMALVDHRPRTASVVADTDLVLLKFNSRAFRQLLDEMPKASERVMTMLHERLERST